MKPSSSAPERWLAYREVNPRAKMRMFCFPYAGGGASIYRGWGASLPGDLEVCPVQIPGRDNAMPPDRLADAARALGMRVENAASVEAALQTLSRLAYEVPPRILITGSLYLAGPVLAANGTPPG